MYHILLISMQIAATPLLSPLMIGLVRKAKARMQNRTGASIFQPYRDLWKLFHKDETVSRDASWISTAAPYIVFGVTVVLGASIPLLGAATLPLASSDLLTVIYLIALGTFFLALAGMDTGGGFGGFGASREMTMAALTEAGLLFSFLPLAIYAKSAHLESIAAATAGLPVAIIIPWVLCGLAYGIAMLSETARFPFDNPATHLELTMMHEAMILEYSGKKLALMEWAAANKFFIFLILGANIFLPFTPNAASHWLGMATLVGVTAIKVIGIAVGVAILESSIAKYRMFRLPDLLFGSFILGLIAISFIH